MNHYSLIGTHYNAGLSLGRAMKEAGQSLAEVHILNLSPEKQAFGQACAEVCKREYPALLEEIRGIADGQQMAFDDLAAFLFGIYNFPPFQGCTCFAVHSGQEVIFGRNSDFLTALEPFYGSFFYRLVGELPLVGNSTALVQLEDGVNAYGLAAGLTFIWPVVKQPGLNAGMLVRYVLAHCKTVDEAITALRGLTISSAQTITLADRNGGMAVVECNAECFEVIRPCPGEDFVVTANDFNSPAMQRYRAQMPDDLFSQKRYRVARTALEGRRDYDLAFTEALLSGKLGFLCQYDRRFGADTVWSSIYQLREGQILRCEGNPSRAPFLPDPRLTFHQ